MAFPDIDTVVQNLKSILPAGYRVRKVWGGGKDRIRISKNLFLFTEVKLDRKNGAVFYQSSWIAYFVITLLSCLPLALLMLCFRAKFDKFTEAVKIDVTRALSESISSMKI